MTRAPPPWLVAFQKDFSEMIRTPLDPSSGTLRASESKYPPALRDATRPGPSGGPTARLAVYNRQYWFRLFGALQGEFPLVARLMGLFHFNQAAQRFLLEHPPRGVDLRLAARGFDRWLAETGELELCVPLPREALNQAAEIDLAWSDVWMAPEVPPWTPSPEELAGIEGRWLQSSPAVRVVEEGWALVEVRRTLGTEVEDRRLPLPPRHPQPRAWAVIRRGTAIGQLALSPARAQLMRALEAQPFGAALALVESSLSQTDKEALVRDVGAWMAEGRQLGFWTEAR